MDPCSSRLADIFTEETSSITESSGLAANPGRNKARQKKRL